MNEVPKWRIIFLVIEDMGLIDAFVHVIKSEIRLVKEAISDKHDDGYVYDVMPEENFRDMEIEIRRDFDDAPDIEDGDVIRTTDWE